MAKTTSEIKIWKDEKQLATIKEQYGQNLSDAEFGLLCGIGAATGLNPFLREIWAVKYGNKPANIFIGRDGYRKVAQENPAYDWHFVDVVYSKDTFSVKNGDVEHSYGTNDRGKIIGAYCQVQRKKSTKPLISFVEFSEYNTNQSVWKTKPATMIKKVAEAQGLRGAFQGVFAGTYDESENWEKENPLQAEVVPEKPKQTAKPKKKATGLTMEDWQEYMSIWDQCYEILHADNPEKYTPEKKNDVGAVFACNRYKVKQPFEIPREKFDDLMDTIKEKFIELKAKQPAGTTEVVNTPLEAEQVAEMLGSKVEKPTTKTQNFKSS